MTTGSIFHQTGPFYYPFTKPLTGNINDLCSNPTNFGCNLNTNYSTTNCGPNSKPVLDCGIGTSAVCCPEKIFPYAKTTSYCTYLNNQGCFKHQKYSWPRSTGISIPCPTNTYDVSDCGLCCPPDITNNMNFTNDPYDPDKNNIVGNVWNKDNTNLENGIYKITINNQCLMNFVDQTMPVMYQKSNYPTDKYPGDCGGTWIVTKMAEKYIGQGVFPSSDLKYVPGGYTLFNTISGLYLSLRTSQFGNGIEVSLSSKPTVVSIFKNSDGSYRIQNAKNQIGSFSGIGNIGNPVNCAIVDQNNNFKTYNWGNGLSGLPCGINTATDQTNYKFQFTKVTNVTQTDLPATLPDGEYYIEVGNDCISFDGTVSNYGGNSGTCGTLLPRFGVNTGYKWIVINEPGGGFSLQNEINGNYLQEPVYGKTITTGPNRAILNILKNSDNSVRITSSEQICLTYENNTLKGFNWNVNTLECGTGPNATVSNYKFKFVPVPESVIPPVSDLPNGEGVYEINTISDGVLFDKETGGGIYQTQPVVFNEIPNILQMSNKASPNNLSEQRWQISKARDIYDNSGYTFQNLASKKYITLSSDPKKVLTTTPTKTVLFLYINSDGSYTIQNQSGACLNGTQQKYANTFGGGAWNYYYTTLRENQSINACGMSTLSSNVSFRLNFINPPSEMQNLTGNGGNCTYTWYNTDLLSTVVSGFSDQVSCDTAITVAKQNAALYNIPTDNITGNWTPFFDGEAHILYTYGGKCLSVDNNGNVIASTNCSKNSCVTTQDENGNYITDCSPSNKKCEFALD